MSQRIDPIGPYDRRLEAIHRVERRERTHEERDPEQEREAFDEQLERGLRERKKRPGDDNEPAVQVDLSPEAAGPNAEPIAGPVVSPQGNDPDDGLPHIDISV